MEHWEVDENTNVDVLEENEENYPRSSEYAETQANALDEYYNHTHIKGIENWIKQGTQSKHRIMNLWIWR